MLLPQKCKIKERICLQNLVDNMQLRNLNENFIKYLTNKFYIDSSNGFFNFSKTT